MNNTDHDFKLIEDFFEDKLDEAQKNTIADRLEKEPEFKSLFQKVGIAIQATQQSAEEETLALIENIAANNQSRYRKLAQRISIAAAILLLALCAFWLWPSGQSTQKLYEAYYERPNFDLQRNGNEGSELEVLRQSYNATDYSQFLDQIAKIESKEPLDFELQLLKGIALLESEQAQEALQLFESLSQNNQNLDRIYWYTALAQLKIGEAISAKATLEKLLNSDIQITENRQKKVQELLKKI